MSLATQHQLPLLDTYTCHVRLTMTRSASNFSRPGHMLEGGHMRAKASPACWAMCRLRHGTS